MVDNATTPPFWTTTTPSDGWYGDLLELRVYNRPYEGAELTSLNNELMTKWGVTPDA